MGCTGWIHASYSPILRLIPRFKFDKRIIVYSLYFILFPSSFGTMALISFSFFSWEKRGVNKKKEKQVDSLVQIGKGIDIDPKGLGLPATLNYQLWDQDAPSLFGVTVFYIGGRKDKEEKKRDNSLNLTTRKKLSLLGLYACLRYMGAPHLNIMTKRLPEWNLNFLVWNLKVMFGSRKVLRKEKMLRLYLIFEKFEGN